MTTELTFLVWTLVLALVQIAMTATFGVMDSGLSYAAGPRDVPPRKPYGKITGRLMRAQKNLFETLPIFIAALLIAHVLKLDSKLTYWGAQLYFWARLVYVPIYAAGIPHARTAVWVLSLVGLIMVLAAVV